MNINKLISAIDTALREIENLVKESNYYNEEEECIISTKKVLNLLKDGVQTDSIQINERILRAMHDIGMSSYRDFENTPLENAINNVTSILYKEIPYYKNLKPLRMDFGKGNPI